MNLKEGKAGGKQGKERGRCIRLEDVWRWDGATWTWGCK